MKSQDKVLVVIGTVAVMTVAGVTGYTLFATKNSEQAKSSNTTNTAPMSSSNAPTTPQQSSGSANSTASYRDGTYDATQSYMVPHGSNSVSVKLTVAGGKITDVSTTNDYQDEQSAQYVDWFDQEIKSTVVGQSLGDASVSRVGGASLTSMAFNDVLDTIRNDAKT